MNVIRQGTFSVKQAGSFLILGLLTLSLTACGDSGITTAKLKGGSSHTLNDAGSALLTPLHDLNIKSDEIPEKLQALTDNPYTIPKPLDCTNLKDEMADLDGLLGPDVDAPKVALTANEQYAQTGADIIHDSLIGLVRSQTSFLPFRGIIRKITGAEAHDKAMAAANQAGKLRRAYLKGLASAKFGDKCIFEPIVVTETGKEDEKTPEKSAPDLEMAKK